MYEYTNKNNETAEEKPRSGGICLFISDRESEQKDRRTFLCCRKSIAEAGFFVQFYYSPKKGNCLEKGSDCDKISIGEYELMFNEEKVKKDLERMKEAYSKALKSLDEIKERQSKIARKIYAARKSSDITT